ncbi:MAG: serine--tRNA ligase [Caulobacteraceae bacterium]|nr:serine--tRNA ligase [Caulobacter sp.]
MHDIRAIREAPERYVDGWSRRGVADAGAVVDEILELDRADRAAKTRFEGAQAERNAKSKLIGAAKAAKEEARAAALMAEVEALKATLAEAEAAQKAADAALNGRDGVLARLPNLAAEGVPHGEDEAGNVEQKRWRDPSATPAGERGLRVDHATLGEALGLMDFERAARMSGSRFVALKGGLARLERALGQFMLDVQTREHGYMEVSPPLLVRDDAVFGTGQLPKFAEDLFRTQSANAERLALARKAWIDREVDERVPGAEVRDLLEAAWIASEEADREFIDHRWLIPTAEVSLTNLVREEITPEDELPLRLTALTPCFRSEAGASGRDTRGMIRQHQFHKVELVSITPPEQSEEEHERMTACAEAVLEKLGLPYRRMLLCDGDMGFSARRTYDLEVWLPSEGRYREISSCSTCGDFQARRMEARFKRAGEKGAPYVHTLNGSGLAVGRALVAVMESYQDEGGRIAVPDALLGHTGGMTHVERG